MSAPDEVPRPDNATPREMIRNGDLLRFTPDEIERFRSAAIDVARVLTIEDFGAAIARWCDLLQEDRPDLLEKIARAMAETRGVKLPPKLRVYDGGTGAGKP
jgi:hypothetical protein